MACTTCASECMCAVVSGDTVIGVTGVGSGAVPYTITANVCNGLADINDPGRNILGTDKAVVLDNAGACQLVTVPDVCGIPNGGTVNQLLYKGSATNCDVVWASAPYAKVSDTGTIAGILTATQTLLDFDTTVLDPEGMHTAATTLTVPAVWAGWWGFGASMTLLGAAAGDYCALRILVNAAVVATHSAPFPATNNEVSITAMTEQFLAAGDLVTFAAYWVGAAGPVTVGSYSAWASWRSA